MPSNEYEAARLLPEVKMAGAVEFTFPAFDALPEKKIKIATSDIEVDGEQFNSRLLDIPLVRGQRGAAQDTADFQVNDPKGDLYDQIKPYEDVLEDTKVIVKECLFTSKGIYEFETVLTGYLEKLVMSEVSMQLNFSAVSDMSRTGALVGGRILAQRYCSAIFNKDGLRDPEFDACGWVIQLGGNSIFCSHKLEGADGCKEHMNAPRYLAVEALSTAQVTYSGSDGGGWGYGGGGHVGCFHPLTGVWMADGSVKPIHKVSVGDLVFGWGKDGKVKPGRVGDTMTHLVDMLMTADFGKDRLLNVAAEHAMSIDEKSYRCIGAIDVGDPLRRFDEFAGWRNTVFLRDWLTEKRTRLHNFFVEELNNYFVVVGNLKLGVSNNKPVLLDVIQN